MPEWVGVLLGLISVVIAAVALIKQQKLEKRVKEKDKLRLLAKKLKDDTFWYTNSILSGIKDPLNNEDLISQL
jgi:hypothetical protein